MRSLIVGVGFLVCLLSVIAHGDDAPKSLLSNSDFSEDGGNDWPADWPKVDGSSWQKEGDQRFLRLEAAKPGQMILVYRQARLPAPPPPALEVKLRVRYQDLKPGEKPWFDGRVMFHFKNEAGQVLKPDPGAPNFRGTSKGWVEKSVILKVPAQARLLEVMPCLFQPAGGTLDFAECAVLPATADRLPPPPPKIPSEKITTAHPDALPPELHVVGNEIRTKADRPVWLQGLCVDSLEWSAGGEHIAESIPVAIDQWKANVIRLPVKDDFWFGWTKWQKDNGMGYRKIVDAAIDAAASRGAYLALDLHRFGAPTEDHVAFWTDAARRYQNHPAVLFELFNEAHSIPWAVWRDGGLVKDPKAKSADVNVKENSEVVEAARTPGMQALLDAVRAAGARNLVIVGGLDWGYDLSGVVGDHALAERSGGNGIVYSSHIYPWKSDWQGKVLDAAAKYPIFVGEIGCPLERMSFIPPERHEDPYTWAPDALGLIQKHKLHWTGFSFHPKAAPMVISDWQYTPTPYWGAFVKQALSGKQFELKRAR